MCILHRNLSYPLRAFNYLGNKKHEYPHLLHPSPSIFPIVNSPYRFFNPDPSLNQLPSVAYLKAGT